VPELPPLLVRPALPAVWGRRRNSHDHANLRGPPLGRARPCLERLPGEDEARRGPLLPGPATSAIAPGLRSGRGVSREEWDRTWVTDTDREGDGDTRLGSRYTYDEYVTIIGVPRHYSGRDDCAKCDKYVQGMLAEETERAERNRRAIEASMSRKDIYG
jgi:hypothetical protein